MAAVKYAPPAIPPRKKYHTISRCQSGDLSIAVSLAAAVPERHDGADPDDERRPDREQRIRQHVALRQQRLFRQAVRRRLVEQQEERVQAAERTLRIGSVEL